MDETFVWFVPLGGACTYEERGAKPVTVSSADDKRGATIACQAPMHAKMDKMSEVELAIFVAEQVERGGSSARQSLAHHTKKRA
eukprot:169612-Chlamydomonas_euryale.AAC.1